ncbi:coiled-coil domain-containing protein 62 isoform X4 [Echinops telfairi]|uniref:Coiled-coil domain-containing protein 62 isoform X4 n=1 Tax=Echinops telfairi TaxID=9371 RepID=A0AC55DLY1_ECHTE|nr:coiled-coil domain-containing protein 62 isoform X4 [Echinops telfairi]
MNSSATLFSGRQNIGSEAEISTIEKQRKELQLLIGELKDRDKELNEMVTVHQRQLLSWEEDRQKVLTLEERCSKLEGELHKRSEIIRSLTKKVKSLETNQNDCQVTLQKTQQQLQEMAQRATHASLLSEDLEDKDIIEAVNHISDCSSKFKVLEHALRDAKVVEASIMKEKQDCKQKLKTLKIEINKLKEELNEKTTENNDQREEIIRLKQERNYLHDELVLTAEREKRKDDLLDIAKSKQERTNTELHNLRQIYVKQQRDLQFLHFNVENSQEFLQLYDSKMEESKVLESSEPVITVHHASCLVASSSTLREDEKFVGTDPSLDKKNSSKVLLIPQEAVLPSEKGNCSPTSKLQRLLAESRQMVSDLELSTLLPLSSENLSSSDQNILEVSEESADGNALVSN